jgi:hypothetical protein
VNTKTSPASARPLPGRLVPKKRRRPTPTTRGGEGHVEKGARHALSRKIVASEGVGRRDRDEDAQDR